MIFKELDGGLSVIDNLKVAGAKEGKYGVAVIVSENSDASAVFTLSGAIASIIGGFIVTKLNNYNLVFYMSSIGIILTVVFIIIKIKKSDINKINKKQKESFKTKIKEIINTIREKKAFS